MHVLQSLGQDVHAPQVTGLVQPLVALGRAQKGKLEQQRDHAESERPGMLDEAHGAGVGRLLISTSQSHGRSVIARKSSMVESGQPRSRMSLACTVSPRARMARTRLPLPQNGSHTLVTPASNGSCANSGPSAIGGVSNRSSPRTARGRPNEGRWRDGADRASHPPADFDVDAGEIQERASDRFIPRRVITYMSLTNRAACRPSIDRAVRGSIAAISEASGSTM